MNNRRQIHATNINGLGASQVVLSFLQASSSLDVLDEVDIFLPDNCPFNDININVSNVNVYKRFLPNSISRFIECFFSNWIFPNVPTIVLGDIPLRGIDNQVVLVHQPNLVYPKINKFSGKSLKFRINRFLFSINHKYAKHIIVQTGAIAEEMIRSYPNIKSKVVVIPQPVPNWLTQEKNNERIKDQKVYLFYPSAFYPHKKHDFLIKVNQYCLEEKLNCEDFEIWVTLKDEEFEQFKNIKFVKNLGRLNSEQMNNYYEKANALLFISSMESYGLPLIESLTINLPIITADFNYSRWLCENTAYYFEPYKEESFFKAINTFKRDYELGLKVNYTQVLKKFPKKWEEVVIDFNHLLID